VEPDCRCGDDARIDSMRVQGGRPVVTFAGYEDVDRAQELAGVELRIPEGELQPLATVRTIITSSWGVRSSPRTAPRSER
jgi:hypothetical protein